MKTETLPVETEPEVLDDVYEREVERLANSHRETVYRSWKYAGPLFQYCSRSGGNEFPECGCLTMVRGSSRCLAHTADLTEAIRSDERIPCGVGEMEFRWPSMSIAERRSLLRVFSYWQRRLDREIRGERA